MFKHDRDVRRNAGKQRNRFLQGKKVLRIELVGRDDHWEKGVSTATPFFWIFFFVDRKRHFLPILHQKFL
jgi:hypothetical protein